MTKIQELREIIRSLNFEKFTLSKVKIKKGSDDYFRLRELVSLKEVLVEGKAGNAIYQATDALKKYKKPKTPKQLLLRHNENKDALIGWRSVFPSMFNPITIKGNTTIYKQSMV